LSAKQRRNMKKGKTEEPGSQASTSGEQGRKQSQDDPDEGDPRPASGSNAKVFPVLVFGTFVNKVFGFDTPEKQRRRSQGEREQS
jgi:ribosome assembly protein YihI (activator of Der GTPase)